MSEVSIKKKMNHKDYEQALQWRYKYLFRLYKINVDTLKSGQNMEGSN